MDNRVYSLSKNNGRWVFMAHTGTDISTSDVVFIPIETWTTAAGEHQLCRVGYSKQRATRWTLRAALGDIGAMEGPDLFVVTRDKQIVLGVWKPPIDGVEIWQESLARHVGEDDDCLEQAKAMIRADGVVAVELDANRAPFKQWKISV